MVQTNFAIYSHTHIASIPIQPGPHDPTNQSQLNFRFAVTRTALSPLFLAPSRAVLDQGTYTNTALNNHVQNSTCEYVCE